MSKFVLYLLLFLFISGTVTVTLNPTTATDTVENTWNTKTPMKHKTSNIAIVVANSKIYAIDRSNGILECYNPATDKWTTLTPHPALGVIAAVAYQDKIYCIDSDVKDEFSDTRTDGPLTEGVIYVYDPVADSWNTESTIPTITGWIVQAQVIDGKIFVITKEHVDVKYQHEYDNTPMTTTCHIWHLYVYDPVDGSWVEKTKIPYFSPNRNREVVSVVMDDKLMVFGIFFTKTTLTIENNNWESKSLSYNPKTDQWTDLGTTPLTFMDIMWTFLPIAGATSGVYAPPKIYFFLDMKGTVVYDPLDNSYSTAEPMQASGNGYYDVAVVDDLIYVIGEEQIWYSSGAANSNYLNLQYIPIGYHSTLPTTTRLTLNNPLIITTLTLTISTITISLTYLIHKKRHTKKTTKLSKLKQKTHYPLNLIKIKKKMIRGFDVD